MQFTTSNFHVETTPFSGGLGTSRTVSPQRPHPEAPKARAA